LLESEGITISGISLTADELELYYARRATSATGTVPEIVRRRRASKSEMFGSLEVLNGLAGVCAADHPLLNPDVTDDGLSLYVTCTQDAPLGASEGVSPLRVATRAARGAAFTLAPDPVGGVFASAGISADELTAYTDGEIFDTPPRMFTRGSKTESFGQPQAVAGIDTGLRSPDIASDGLALFGAAGIPGEGSGIVRALRSSRDQPFAAPVPLELGLMPTDAVGAPNVVPSCALYMIVLTSTMPSSVYVAQPL
jgi:hypothetical protein